LTPNLDYDTLATEYAAHRTVHPGVLRQLLERGGLGVGSLGLDVGCGSANYLAALQQATGATIHGVDPSAEMLAHAREKAPNSEFVQGRAESLPWSDATFDLVFSVDVIHHLSDRSAASREAFRVLKPGGRICIVTDSEDDLVRRVPLTKYFPETLPLERQRYPPVAGIQQELAEAGFERLPKGHARIAYPLTDMSGFRAKAYSLLHLIEEKAFAAGIARMEADLAKGPIEALSLYTLIWARKP
jgi:ubiquinone/menaquinone biosynthesis C-methylase UbiE